MDVADDKRFRYLIEKNADAIVVISLDGVVRYMNPAAESLFGFKSERIIGEPFGFPIVSGESTELNVISRTGRSHAIEMRVVETEWEGEATHLASLRDITARKAAEDALRKSEENYRQLVQSANSIIFRMDAEGRFTFFNDYGLDFFGYTRDEMLGMRYQDTLATEDGSDVSGPGGIVHNLVANSDRSSSHESESVLRDGTRKWIAWTNSAIVDEEGDISEILCVGNDITRQKHLESQLRQSQKMEAIGTLSGGIAHDFNNLLTTIIGNADFCLMQLDGSNPIREDVEEIRRAGDRASNLTRQLLAFSRKQMFREQVLSLNDIITDMEKMLVRMIGEHIELGSILDPDLSPVKVDPGQMEQVLMNLAVNSRDAMPEGGKLTIETQSIELATSYFVEHNVSNEAGHYVMLSVTDDGEGMDEETRDQIFEPFFTTKEQGRGTGLGLSTVYGIVKQSRGYIWVYSEPGKGTSFKIYLPVADSEDAAAGAGASIDGPVEGSETLLIVEDDSMLLEITRKALTAYGYTILAAPDGERALDLVKNEGASIDLMVTDIVMPGMDGTELARQVGEAAPELKVLFMSGYTDDTVVRHGMLSGELNFIMKPYTPEGLACKVREVLDH